MGKIGAAIARNLGSNRRRGGARKIETTSERQVDRVENGFQAITTPEYFNDEMLVEGWLRNGRPRLYYLSRYPPSLLAQNFTPLLSLSPTGRCIIAHYSYHEIWIIHSIETTRRLVGRRLQPRRRLEMFHPFFFFFFFFFPLISGKM